MPTNNNNDKKSLLEFAQKKFKTTEYDKLAMQGKVKPTENTSSSANNNKKDWYLLIYNK